MAATYTLSNTLDSTLSIKVPEGKRQFNFRIDLVNANTDEVQTDGTIDVSNYFRLDISKRDDIRPRTYKYITKNGDYFIKTNSISTLRFMTTLKGVSSGNITIIGFFSDEASHAESKTTLMTGLYYKGGIETHEGTSVPLKINKDGGLSVSGEKLDEIMASLDMILKQGRMTNYYLSLITDSTITETDVD